MLSLEYEFGVSQRNFAAAVTRLINKGRLANPRHGFLSYARRDSPDCS
jgi:hypothetical protein